jgi:hypothetical protein
MATKQKKKQMKTSFSGTFTVGELFPIFLYDEYDEGVIAINTFAYQHKNGLYISTESAEAATRVHYHLKLSPQVTENDADAISETCSFRLMRSKIDERFDGWSFVVCPKLKLIDGESYHYELILTNPSLLN